MTDIDILNDRLARLELQLRAIRQGRAGGGRRMLITGGTGTLGVALTEQFLKLGWDLTVLSRNAHVQANYQARFPQVRCVLTDICNDEAVLEACIGQDVVIHAAAQKRVDIGETQVVEFARVNIDGTRCVAAACATAGVPRNLFISSDKAVSPLNLYGVTKAIGERLWVSQDMASGYMPTRFSCVRYGNVMGSNGSVLQVWRDRLARGEPISVREPDTTRFLMLVKDAVALVVNALAWMQGGEIFVPAATPAFALHELAAAFAPADTWQRAPLGPREKQHEALLAPGEYWEPVCDEPVVRVWPGRSGAAEVPPQFRSATAHRLAGREVMQLLDPHA